MKKSLFILIFFLSSSLFGQEEDLKEIVTTHYISESDMIWNESQQDYIFIETEERYRSSSLWIINLRPNGTGHIKLEYLDDGTTYLLAVYSWKEEENIDDSNNLWIDFIKQEDGSKGKIYFQRITNEVMISVFLPEEKLMLTFDNIRS